MRPSDLCAFTVAESRNLRLFAPAAPPRRLLSTRFGARSAVPIVIVIHYREVMASPTGFTRPQNPQLARVFDRALRDGLEIRYADNTQVVVYRRNRWGCGGILLLILLGIVTAFIVPIILLLLGMLAPGGRVIMYTLKPNGKVKKKSRAARN